MSYIKDSLSNGEEIVRVFEHHWMIKVTVVLHFILAVLTIGIWLPVAVFIWLHWKYVEQGLTNRRVIYKSGIISRRTDEMRLKAVESIYITQGVLGRILGYGTVTVTGRGLGDVKLKWMTDPMRVKRDIESAEFEKVEANNGV